MKKSILFLVLPLLLCGCKKEDNGNILVFEFDEITSSYSVKGFNENVKAENKRNLIIPSTYNDFPVTKICDSAFIDETELESIVLPDSIQSLGERAFEASGLRGDLDLGENISFIGNMCFSFTNIETIVYKCKCDITFGSFALISGLKTFDCQSNDVRSIGSRAFACSRKLEEIHLNNEIECIEDEAFINDFLIKKINFPASLKKVYADSFDYLPLVEEFVLPAGLESVYIDDGPYNGPSHYIEYSFEEAINNFETFFCHSDFGSIKIAEGSKYYDDNSNYIRKGNEILLGCHNTTFTNQVTKIKSYAFYGIQNCTLTIPASITEIEEKGFNHNSMVTLNCEASTKPEGWNALWANDKLTNINWGVTI